MIKIPRKIMIFGRPGSGKSTFAHKLNKMCSIPLYHLDKYFFTSGWVERDYQEFMRLQEEMVAKESWIIDGNSTRSLETRWAAADLVIYFNYPRLLCLYRSIKRLFCDCKHVDDRTDNCPEVLRWKFVKYMWRFDARFSQEIKALSAKYPNAKLIEINSDRDLNELFSKMSELCQ